MILAEKEKFVDKSKHEKISDGEISKSLVIPIFEEILTKKIYVLKIVVPSAPAFFFSTPVFDI